MKYLKKYSTEAERQAATAIEPSASIVVEDEGVYYDRAWDTPTEVVHENRSPYWTWDWQFIRPAEWPDLGIFDMENINGIVATYDCRGRIADERCLDNFIIRWSNTPCTVERGTVVNGQFVVNATIEVATNTVYRELLPTNEGDFVVYKVTQPTIKYGRLSLNPDSATRRDNDGNYYSDSNKIVELLINLKNTDTSVYSYSNILRHYEQYNKSVSSDIRNGYANLRSLEYLDMSGRTITVCYTGFANSGYKKINFTGATTSAMSSFNSAFLGCTHLEELDVSNFTFVSGSTNQASLFENCYNLKELDVSNWDTQYATSFAKMFYYCMSLKQLDVSSWNTANVTTMVQMFTGCKNLQSLDLRSWDFSKVTTLASFLQECRLMTTLLMGTVSLSLCTTINGMFTDCNRLLECPMSGKTINLSACTNISNLFARCYGFEEIDMSGWDLSGMTNGQNAQNVFYSCTNLKKIVLPASLSVIHGNSFAGCNNLKTLIMNVATPPTATQIQNQFSTWNPNYKIYVPDASVDTYKTATGWLNAASHIYGISTYTGD